MAPEGGALKTEGFLTSADGTRIAYRAWPLDSPRQTFAVVHGMGEHSGRYERFARGMAKFRIATYAVDLRGHGRSEGQRGHIDSWSQWVDDGAAFVAHVESQAGGEVVPLGHSFGGVVVLSVVLAGKMPQARRFVLSSPALKLKADNSRWQLPLAGVMSALVPGVAVNNQVDPRMISRVPEEVAAYRTDPLVHSRITSRTFVEWHRAAQQDLERAGEINVPFLITAGTADRLIDSAGSVELHRRAPKTSDLRLLEGRYHEPFNDQGNEEVFALIADWLGR